MLTILMLSILMPLLIIMTNHPLSLGLLLLSQTLMAALISSFLNPSSWFSYILFLIMVGGMLVLFMYMTSVASNEKFKLSNKMIIIIAMFSSTISVIQIIDSWMVNLTSKFPIFVNTPIMPYLNKFLNFPLIIMSLLIIIFLLLTLVAVIKIINIKYGPLRTLN
uniref:NADH-ubiquinone oxidoreductase chain 6 n=1 Tax=Nigidius sp. NIG01 TaxID=1205568 RepID=A0A0S2MPK7_9SCAR|nr:NADH deshydrogenase subunit 6 [Nigidius sp. NIG01]